MIDLEAIVTQIQETKGSVEITPRALLNSLGCERRTRWNCWYVDDYLNKHNLEVEPGYNDVWIDAPIQLRHKKIAKTECIENPVRSVRVLASANRVPVYVGNNDSLGKATTLMRIHGFSQLPVTNNGERGLVGYISWETIGVARNDGNNSDQVSDYKSEEVFSISQDTPLLSAVPDIIKHRFAVVLDRTKKLCGIITMSDLAGAFLSLAKPFLLLDEIEKHIRNILNEKFLLESVRAICAEKGRTVENLDDLTYGEYLRLMQDPENWSKLNLKLDKDLFLKLLEEVRIIRNDVMHFDPEGISEEQQATLEQAAKLLSEVYSRSA